MGPSGFSLHSQGKRTLVIWFWALQWNGNGRQRCLVSGSALCPFVCLSVSECVQRAVLPLLLTNPPCKRTGQISASELDYCSPNEPKVHENGSLVLFGHLSYLSQSTKSLYGHMQFYHFIPNTSMVQKKVGGTNWKCYLVSVHVVIILILLAHFFS